MDCIEQIWKLALGDNSPLANAAKSAADELDQLRAKLAEAQEQISEFQQATADIHLWRTGYRRQLAEAQAEIERLKAEYAEDVGKLLRSTKYIAGIAERGFGAPQPDSVSVEDFVLGYVKQLEQQLAASQATNEKLREALGKFRDNVLFRIGSASPYRKVAQEYFEYIAPILALHNDTTALNKLLAGVYEECAKLAAWQQDGLAAATEIREIAKQKGLTS